LSTINNLNEKPKLEQLNTQNGEYFKWNKPLNIILYVAIITLFMTLLLLNLRKLEFANYLVCGFNKFQMFLIILCENIPIFLCVFFANLSLVSFLTHNLLYLDKLPLFINMIKILVAIFIADILATILFMQFISQKNIYKYFREI
jgi:hypothetical protein